MNYQKITEDLLKREVPQNQVEILVKYLQDLEKETDKSGAPKNAWMKYVQDQDIINAMIRTFERSGLWIDGEQIILTYRKKLIVTFTYQAYKNQLLGKYPESTFDIQLVHSGDSYSFKKDSGVVQYTHIMGDPFVKGREIVGAYMVIKNRRGQFLEVLNMDDITKIRSVAKTQAIWTAWLDRMILKSMMKRSCKMHFNDITGELDKVDNEENDLEKVGLEPDVQTQIENAGTLDELQEIYVEHKETTENQPALMAMLGARKKEIKKEMAS